MIIYINAKANYVKSFFLVTILLMPIISFTQEVLCSTKSKRDPLKNISLTDSVKFNQLNVPVIFHIVYKRDIENISDELIYNALKILNDDFLSTNDDLVSVPDEFKYAIGNPNINFQLATILPNGGNTSGIIRVKTNREEFKHKKRFVFRESPIYAPEKYLNVYICNLNTAASTPTGATLRKNKYDNGIRIDYRKITSTSRTISHEVGHWLSLLHTFEGKCRNRDGVKDTPAQKKDFNCPNSRKIQCGNSIMYTNFMGYSTCRNFFSKGQVKRMRTYISKYKQFYEATIGE
ncbi:M43 family zinc metalloprotease [Winogradskyella sp.]|uniref:M43 family zinc metalloprotease n=1 Tax=Winogradskyella sp. TaxID=1883156 RepID=UPI0025E7E149|nr:M43 family zinc metalloprotease [Winogradskyella sp.]